MQQKFEKIKSLLDCAKTVAIVSHVNPDGDTVGSGLALYEALKMYGLQPYIFCDDAPNDRLKWLPLTDCFNEKSLEAYDVSFCIDCADAQRMGKSFSEYKKGKTRITIDHHKTNDSFSDINYIDSKASATAELVFLFIEFLDKTKPVLTKDCATLLYSGIVTDSGCFSFSSVSKRTHYIAGRLLERDINNDEICYHFTKAIAKVVYNLKNRVLSKTSFYFDDKVAVIAFMQEDFMATGANIDTTEGIINNALNVNGVEIAVSITEVSRTKQTYKVSFRTKGNVDASRCALVFGGGGHKNASGCQLYGCFEEVLEKILKVCSDSL